jgi:hypothetical protein
MGDLVVIIGSCHRETHDLFEVRDHVERLHIFGEYSFRDLSPDLHDCIFFPMWTGLLSSNLPVACEKITGIVKRSYEMERNGNIYFSACQVVFMKRILRRADLMHLILSFMVSQ